MAVDVQRVRFDEPADIRYEGEDYNFKTGDEAVFRHNYARRVCFKWDLAHNVSQVYELVEDEYEEEKGLKKDSYGDDGYSYSELQSLAKEYDDIPANQSAEELRAALEEVDGL